MCAGFAVTVGVGLTITEADITGPGQPSAEDVIVKVTVTGTFDVLTKVPDMLPVPDACNTCDGCRIVARPGKSTSCDITD